MSPIYTTLGKIQELNQIELTSQSLQSLKKQLDCKHNFNIFLNIRKHDKKHFRN